MDTVVLAVALIRKLDGDGMRWLGRLNPATETLRFVIGHPTDKESIRESITKEVAWEFELDRKHDFLVSNMAQLNAVFPDSVPAVAGRPPLQVSFYNVELYRRNVRQLLSDDPRNVWLTSEEIYSGISTGGLKIDPLVHQLVTRSQVIRSWESSS